MINKLFNIKIKLTERKETMLIEMIKLYKMVIILTE